MNGKPYHVEITVINRKSNSDISMKMNGVPFLEWHGDPTTLQVNAGRATRDGRTLGIAVCHSATMDFPVIRVRALTGTISRYVPGQ